MALTKEQRLAIINSVLDRAKRGEPYLTPALAAASRKRKLAKEASDKAKAAQKGIALAPPDNPPNPE